jgi:hypothetical protein
VRARPGLLVAALVLLPRAGAAQNVEVVIKEEALNRLVDRLRDPSDSGVYQPTLPTHQPDTYTECREYGTLRCAKQPDGTEMAVPLVICKKKDGGNTLVPAPEAVAWQWWITGSRFQAKSGSLAFTAKLRTRIDGRWRSEEKTVPATVSFDASASVLRVQVSAFKLPVRYEGKGLDQTITEVDVAKLSSFAIRVTPPSAQMAAPGGGARTLTARVTSGTAVYEPGRVRLRFDTTVDGFNVANPPAWNVGNPGLEDGRIGIQESLLNEMAAALVPLTYQTTMSVPFPVPNPFFPLGPPFWIINIPCGVRADVTGVRFDVEADPAPIGVTGQVNGSLCGFIPFGGPISTTASVTHNATSRTLRINTGATSFRPNVAGITVPFTVNVGPALSVPPIPFRHTVLDLETTAGPLGLVLSGEDVALSKRNGIIEVRGNVALR